MGPPERLLSTWAEGSKSSPVGSVLSQKSISWGGDHAAASDCPVFLGLTWAVS